jgi:hypothetical protein
MSHQAIEYNFLICFSTPLPRAFLKTAFLKARPILIFKWHIRPFDSGPNNVFTGGTAGSRGVPFSQLLSAMDLGRLGLVTAAQNTRQQIHAKGSGFFPGMEPGLTWVTLTAIFSLIFSM